MSRRAGKAKAPDQDVDSGQPDIADEIRRLQKTQALLIAVQFAANHEAEFDVSDALAAILTLIGESLAGLDRLDVVT